MDANPYATPGAALERPSLGGQPTPPLWNPDAAGLWSLLLTPVFGSTLIWRNWIAIGERSKANLALFWLAVSVLFLLVAILLTPRLSLPYIIVWYFACQRPQTLYIRKRWGIAYPRRPWLVPILCMLGGILLLGVVVGVLSALNEL